MACGEERSDEKNGQEDVEEEEVEERFRIRILNSMRSRMTALCCAYLIAMLVVGGASTQALQVILKYEVRKGDAALGRSRQSVANASANDLHVLFNQTYLDGTGSYWIVQTSDGGYLIGGTTRESPGLVKVDWNGEVVWNKTYGDDAGMYWYRTVQVVVEDDSGGFLILGRARLAPGGVANQDDLFLLRVDEKGNSVWNKTLRSETPTWKSNKDMWREDIGGLLKSQDGFVVVGSVYDVMYDRGVCFVMEIDEEGNKLWERNLSLEGGCDMFEGIPGSGGLVRSPQGGCFLVNGARVHKLDENWDEQWSKWYGHMVQVERKGETVWDREDAYIMSIIDHPDGGFVVAGRIDNATTRRDDVYVARLDLNGNVIWESQYGEPDVNEWGRSIAATGDGFVVAGTFATDSKEGYMVKVGLNGEKVWELKPDALLIGVVPSYEGGFVAIDWDWGAISFYEGEPPSQPISESPAILGSIAMVAIMIMAVCLGVAFLSKRSRPDD